MIGKSISHYKIISKLGEGGMGIVYKAEDTKLDRFVALKFLPLHISKDEEVKKRFIQEAKAASALQHNNICTIHEIDETKPAGPREGGEDPGDGQMFICMDFYEGETLKHIINGVGAKGSAPLPVDEALNFAIQIADGLQEAHEHKIIHRDIKPANIMITPKKQVKIMDFGIAKLSGQTKLTKDDRTLGTVAYMSPEQAQGVEVDNRSDIWSLGILIYEMLSGQLPFVAEYEQAMIYSIINDEQEPLTGLRTGLPMELERIVYKSLMKNSDERYQHVDEMLVDLKKIKNEMDRTEINHPSKVKDKVKKKRRLHRIIVPVAVMTLAALAFFVLKSFFFAGINVSAPKPIAVLPFENLTGEIKYDILRKSITSLFINKLEQTQYLQVTTWERMGDILKQLGKDKIEIVNIDLETGFDLCRLDGVHDVVTGKISKIGDMFALDVKVLDVETKRTITSATQEGRGENSIFKQIDQISKEIAKGVGLSQSKIDDIRQPIAEVFTNAMEAYNFFMRGMEEYEKSYHDEARRFLEKAVKLDSTFAGVYLWLGLTHKSLRNTKAKNAAYKKAWTLSQKSTLRHRLTIEAMYAQEIEKDIEKRIRILGQITKLFPKEKRAHYNLGIHYWGKKMYLKAIEAYTAAIELDPNFGAALNGLGYTYADMGDYTKAIKYFEMYASVSPGDSNPFDSMAEIYFQMGELDNAIRNYRKAIDVNSDFVQAYIRVAYCCALNRNYSESTQWIDQLISKAPSFGIKAEGYLWKSLYGYWLGYWDQSLSDLNMAADQAKEVDNKFVQAYINLLKGWIYFDKGDFELSRDLFTSWYKNAKENLPPYRPSPSTQFYTAMHNLHLGLLDLKEGQIDSAKFRLAEMKALLPEINLFDARIKYFYDLFYGELLLAEGFADEAIAVCENLSLTEIPYMHSWSLILYNTPLPTDVTARAYIKNGALNEAVSIYERLITFDPNGKERRLVQPKYHYRLAKLYEMTGKKDGAITQYEKFLEIWKDADEDLPERIDAQQKLAELKGDE